MFTTEIGIKIDHSLIKCYELKTLFIEILRNYKLFTNPLRGIPTKCYNNSKCR